MKLKRNEIRNRMIGLVMDTTGEFCVYDLAIEYVRRYIPIEEIEEYRPSRQGFKSLYAQMSATNSVLCQGGMTRFVREVPTKGRLPRKYHIKVSNTLVKAPEGIESIPYSPSKPVQASSEGSGAIPRSIFDELIETSQRKERLIRRE